MSTRSLRLVSASILVAAFVAGCGDDTEGTGGAGGEGTTSTSTSTGTTTTTTATNTTTTGGQGGEGGGDGGAGQGGEGVGGEGGAAEGGGGGTSACLGELPDSYDGADFADNAAGVLALRGQLGALNAAMAAAETDPENDLVVAEAELIALYEAGEPSLADGITAYYDGVVRDVFASFEPASDEEWTPLPVPVPPGGKYGSYIFDETGRDLRQWVEKGHFNSFFYPAAVALVEGGLDAAEVDQLLALYGAHPDFPGDSSADTAANPDRLAAQYAERRSPKNTEDPSQPLDPASPGVYFTVKGDFITLQAAVANGCDEDRDAAAERILAAWERDVMAATVVYYLNDATIKLTTDGADEATLGSGLHGVGEATSFIHGFLEAPTAYRTISDAEVESILELLADPYRFVVDPATEVTDLLAAVDELAAVYGFTEAELEAFETNH